MQPATLGPLHAISGLFPERARQLLRQAYDVMSCSIHASTRYARIYSLASAACCIHHTTGARLPATTAPCPCSAHVRQAARVTCLPLQQPPSAQRPLATHHHPAAQLVPPPAPPPAPPRPQKHHISPTTRKHVLYDMPQSSNCHLDPVIIT